MTSSTDDPQRPDPAPANPADAGDATQAGDATPVGSRYFLDRPIGQGACGRVWRGRRRSDGTPVAIKVLRPEYTADPDVVSRFLRERTMLEALHHPHLVSVHDLVVEGDTLAVVMELIDGSDLRHAHRSGEIDIDGALTVLAQVSHALAYIHAAGVLHRDIKPENILMTWRDGQPWARLTDFGLSWVADGQRLTRTSHVVGTPAYMAPELLAGRSYGSPVDIYALGVTAYELLCGRRPFNAENPLALMRAHLDDKPSRSPDMAEEHWRVVRACLAKSPQDRPSAAELATQFEDLRSARSPRLGIDFGTCTTTAVFCWPDDRVEALLLDGSPVLSSAVYSGGDGVVLTGRIALAAARLQPQRFEPYPGLRVANGTVDLGGEHVAAHDLVAAVLRRVAEQAQQCAGGIPARVCVAYPPTWGESERAVLQKAAHSAGLSTPQLITGPVGAAAHFVGSTVADVPAGAYALLFDVGAATTSASIVRRAADGGFDLLATEVLPDTGGIDVDAAILAGLGDRCAAQAPHEWQRLSRPEDPPDQQAAWRLWHDVKRAKEELSQAASVTIDVPLVEASVALDRGQFERWAHPVLERAVGAAQAALVSAGVAPADLCTTFLIGGTSRIPLVADLLHEMLGHRPVTVRHPELVVAEGAAHLAPVCARSRDIHAVHDGEPTRSTRTPDGEEDDRVAGSRARVLPETPSGGLPHRRRDPRDRRRATTPRRAGPRRPRLLPATAGTLLLATIITAAYSSLPSTPSRTSGPACGYKIVHLGPSDSGIVDHDGALLAVEQYNAKNPGCATKFVRYDTLNPAKKGKSLAADKAREIVADPTVLGVIGLTSAEDANEAMPILDAAGVVTISPVLADPFQSQRGWRVFHRDVGTDLDDAAGGVRLLKTVVKASKTFVIDDDTPTGLVAAEEARRLLGLAGLAGAGSINYPGDDHAALVNEVRTSGADAVYYTGSWPRFGPLIKQLRAAKPDIRIVGWQWAYADQAIAAAGDNVAQGVLVTCACMPGERAGNGFPERFRARFGRAAYFYAPEGYDAANILLAGLAAGNNTRDGLTDFVHSYDGDGVSGHIRFYPNGDLATPTAWAYRAVNGAFRSDAPIPNDPA